MLKYNEDMSRSAAHADLFQAIADPTRRAILALLSQGEQPVTQLAQEFHVTMSAISQHLSVLREVGLVEVEAVGRERRYRLNADPLQEVADWVNQYERFWRDKLEALGRCLEEEPEEEEDA